MKTQEPSTKKGTRVCPALFSNPTPFSCTFSHLLSPAAVSASPSSAAHSLPRCPHLPGRKGLHTLPPVPLHPKGAVSLQFVIQPFCQQKHQLSASLCPRNCAQGQQQSQNHSAAKQDPCRGTQALLTLEYVSLTLALGRKPKATHHFVSVNKMVLLVCFISAHCSLLLPPQHITFPG